jgi:uncharacterized membrane-anchored protein YhcB (DUF1043 family)
MQQIWLALIVGLILGWLIEWVIDWQFWRRNVSELRQENGDLRRQLDEAQAQLAALKPPVAPLALASAQPQASAAPSDPRQQGE